MLKTYVVGCWKHFGLLPEYLQTKIQEQYPNLVPDSEKKWWGYNLLIIEAPNGTIFVESDLMEPEDCTFFRDLAWVGATIEWAFTEGQKEAIRV